MNELSYLPWKRVTPVGGDRCWHFHSSSLVWELIWSDCWIGVCGFLALCSWLALKSPSFSTLGRYDLIQSSKFLLGRFRLDVWWWELPLLLRGDLDEFLVSACQVPWTIHVSQFSPQGSMSAISGHPSLGHNLICLHFIVVIYCYI